VYEPQLLLIVSYNRSDYYVNGWHVCKIKGRLVSLGRQRTISASCRMVNNTCSDKKVECSRAKLPIKYSLHALVRQGREKVAEDHAGRPSSKERNLDKKQQSIPTFPGCKRMWRTWSLNGRSHNELSSHRIKSENNLTNFQTEPCQHNRHGQSADCQGEQMEALRHQAQGVRPKEKA
jgi:hypothetical protein